ncbi:MAG: 5-dehydro-4-deoxy-D-glucuronate isomerase [Pyrinomonadaceae bacterium]
MFRKTYYPTHPESIRGASNESLRDQYIVDGLFAPGEIVLNYSHFDRIAVGSVVPTSRRISLPVQSEPPSSEGKPFLERRELGAINIGSGKGRITVDGETFDLGSKDCLYIAKESAEVSFESEDPDDPAKFYLLSTLAHKRFETKLITAEEATKLYLGSSDNSNVRTVYQLIIPGVCESSQLVMGLTSLEPGSVWNTCPPHIHERRSEVYLYFDLDDDARMMHFMGQPETIRNITMANEEVVLSPSWSIHMGVGTSNYSFVWAMGGENLDYTDMNVLDICQLR